MKFLLEVFIAMIICILIIFYITALSWATGEDYYHTAINVAIIYVSFKYAERIMKKLKQKKERSKQPGRTIEIKVEAEWSDKNNITLS